MPLFLTVIIGKIIIWASRLTGRGGSALPGLVAEDLDSQILRKLGRKLEYCVLITGTNGKTTTAKMLSDIMMASGPQIVHNRAGSNLSRGIVSTLIGNASLSGAPKRAVGLFEVDEAAMPAVAEALQPKFILVLNLFRDQLDRYGELDNTANLIGQGIAASSAYVILNADDPLVANLAKYSPNKSKVAYFGVEQAPAGNLKNDHAKDSIQCPIGGEPLVYSQTFFAHLGHYSCKTHNIHRPKVLLPLMKVEQANRYNQRLTIKIAAKQIHFDLQLPGLYNTYNAVAALTAAKLLGIDIPIAKTALASVEAAFGRVEKILLYGREIYLLLIKNPTGFNQVIQTFLLDQPANILMAINDNFADGRDVSWLWDVSLESITAQKHQIFTSGTRAADMSLRLKYAGIESRIEIDLEKALDRLIEATPSGKTAYILPTYTSMLALRKIIARRTTLKEIYE